MLVLAVGLVLTFAIMIVRTVATGNAKTTAPLRFAVPALNASAAASNLSTALRFETISYDDSSYVEICWRSGIKEQCARLPLADRLAATL